jgi:hypothetical protein
MSKQNAHGRISTSILLAVGLVLVLVGALSYIGITSKKSAFLLQDFVGNIAKKMELLSGMRANLFNSEQAEKSAVMANTDESSRDFADQSRRAADIVERDRLELQTLFNRDHTDKEMNLFREFDSCWKDLRRIDRIILEFAVQNTNLKAAALSFGKGRETMDRFENALRDLIHSGTAADNRVRIVTLASDAVAAGLNILTLQAPHIIEPRDEKMDEIEAEMRRYAEIVDASLQELGVLISGEDRASLEEAKEAYNEFTAVTAEVVRLSRENTNVKSFELSLGRKRKIAARCDEILISLQETVRSREFKATR